MTEPTPAAEAATTPPAAPASPATPPPTTPPPAAPAAPPAPAAVAGDPAELTARLAAVTAELDQARTAAARTSELESTTEGLRRQAAEAEAALSRMTAARAAGLPDELADRLRGGTAEEMAADAAALAALLGGTTPTGPASAAPTTAPGRPVETLRPASATAAPTTDDTPEAIARLVWGGK